MSCINISLEGDKPLWRGAATSGFSDLQAFVAGYRFESGMDEVLRTSLPSIAARGVFGEGEFLNVSSDDEFDLAVQLGSLVAMVKVNMRPVSGDDTSVPVVIKIQFPDEETRRIRDSSTMFCNEVMMYKEVLPFLNFNNAPSYPKFYYGFASSENEPEKDVVIVENVKYQGFSNSPDKLYLDYNHICLAMKKIGELHGWSYTAKASDQNQFFEVARSLRRVVNQNEESFDFEKYVFQSIKRGIIPFLDEGKYVDVLNNFLEVMESVWSVQDLLYDEQEPFGVVLHGDFCKNNMLYKYDPTGKPIDCIYFDFQLSKYGSPAIDLSFFLYMHTNAKTRDRHWDEFLEIYWNSVKENVRNDTTLPSFQEFLDHFATRAVYGYIPSSFFAPYMLQVEILPMEELKALSEEETRNLFMNLGGEEGQTCLVDIVNHLLKKEYIQSFLDYNSKLRLK